MKLVGVDSIREATITDSDRIAEINVFAWRMAYRRIVADDFLFRKLTVIDRVTSIQQAIDSKTEHFFVCEADGIVTGFTRFGPSRDENKTGVPELYAIYVDPSFQRMGIGRKLINHFLNFPENQGSSESILWVFRDNSDSRCFYESMGFQPDGAEQMYANLAMAVRYSRKN